MARDADELEREFETLRTQLGEVQARAAAREHELADLEDRRNEADARLAMARREVADFEQRVAERGAELEEARTAAAVRGYEDAVAARSAAAQALAPQILRLLEGFAELDKQKNGLVELQSALGRHGIAVELPPESDALVDAWQRLLELVRSSLGEQLEEELIEAAVESPLGQAIEELPEHLRQAARRRWRERRDRSTALARGAKGEQTAE